MLLELGQLLNLAPKAKELADAINDELATKVETGPTVLPMIWHEPLMAVSPTKYAGALLECCGFKVPDIEPEGNGYPVVTPEAIQLHDVEGLLLSSEPMSFQTRRRGDL